MEACDFRNSFMFFEVDHDRAITVTAKQPIKHNRVRIPLESRCEVQTDSGTTVYALTASCKTEKVGVDEDIWMLPNADFCVVSSETDFLILKRWQQCEIAVARESDATAKHTERQVGQCDQAWTAHRRHYAKTEARELATDAEVVDAVMNNLAIVSRTEFELDAATRVLLEYPVKTINVSDRDGRYQVDTGPVLFPDTSIGHEKFIGNFRLAYIAHRTPDWSEFIVNRPTPIADGIHVHHYSEPVRKVTKNSLLVLM